MKENTFTSTLHQIITLFSFVALMLISCYYVIISTLWIYRTRYKFVSSFWGESFIQILILTDLTHFIAFLALLVSAIKSRSLFFEPSQFLLYIIVFWITASSFLLVEANPTRWEERITQIQEFLIANPNSEPTLQFIDFLSCRHSSSDCWEKIDFFVDETFCQFAALFLPIYPLLVGFSIVFII
ncbi:hypothetical protein TRFO_18719 [Tritrichomonas foetus]|uniref:Uncharacterized protein n=1 Tax=Tritrichomonas foetus TaxID=1144522 RepID=A0A1J4KPW0_9EUKA|nr:hypothetical protein TRFO_18719 [Tritrichomonas foetus]|eukprot:OHT11742.1 hypothetical protein TRFO_18719 [Tritrichomonas foetus]